MHKNDIEDIKQLIRNNELQKALDSLIGKVDPTKDDYDSIITIAKRYSQLVEETKKNLIARDTRIIAENNIVSSILKILDSIEEPNEKSYTRDTLQQYYEAIQNYVSEGRINESLKLLEAWVLDKNFDNSDHSGSVAALRNSFKRIQNEEYRGTSPEISLMKEKEALVNLIISLNDEIYLAPKKKNEQKKKQEQIKTSAADYVKDSLQELNDRENTLKIQAQIWYIVGFLSLISGVMVAVSFINLDTVDIHSGIKVIHQIFKSLFIIGLLVAASRYSFNLGKTYMNESLKNADRRHAISFGEFYLKVFDTHIKPEDLKEVFKEWNTSKESPFTKLDSSEFDPKMLNAFIKLSEVVKGTSENQKR